MSEHFMQRAIDLSADSIEHDNGGPFGAVIVKDDLVIAEGYNMVLSTNDPTMHAEIVAIRNACKALRSYDLRGCEIYTNCEPCPMCLGAIYWAHIDIVYYAATKEDAERIGFMDRTIYEEFTLSKEKRHLVMRQIMRDPAVAVFDTWATKADKILY